MIDNYMFEIINDSIFTYTNLDKNDEISDIIHLYNEDNSINLQFGTDGIVKDIEVILKNGNINLDSIKIEKDNIRKNETLDEVQIPRSKNSLLNYSNGHLNIVLPVEDNKISSFYENGSMTYYLNDGNELVMLGKTLGKEEKGFFDYILSPLPIDDPTKVIEEISKREGIDILEASFLGDESWEEKMVNSYYHLRFIYDDKEKPNEITYPYEMNVDIKGIGVRELFKRLEKDDTEAYEMLFSGNILLKNDYVSEIRSFARNNIHYNKIIMKYLEMQQRILKDTKEGDVVPTGFFLDFIRREQLIRIIRFHHKYETITYDNIFEEYYPYIGDLTRLKNSILEYRNNNPLVEIDANKLKLMKLLAKHIIPKDDDEPYDLAARDELLAKADDLKKSPSKKI